MSQGLKKAAVFCIIRSGDKYLLLKRSKMPNAGKYVPPGGKIEPFESPGQAVIREIQEETGMVIRDPFFCGILTESSPTDYNWISYIYLAETEYFDPPACDEGDFYWIDERDLEHLDTPPTDWHIYQYCAAGKHFVFDAEFDENLHMLRMEELLEGLVVFRP
jgi:8-oxo-dGTP diphosphatase